MVTLLQFMALYASAETSNTYSPKPVSRLTFVTPARVVIVTSVGGSIKYTNTIG